MELSERVAIITGASRGLGFEIAKAYAARGVRLIIAARGEETLSSTETELAKETEVVALALDVSQDAERLVQTGLDRFGRIDVLVNNASELGPSPMPALEAYPWEELERVFRVNVLAPLHLTQLVLPAMKERGAGVIINVSSDAGVEAYPGWGGYGSSKAALEHISRTLAVELEESGVRVYAVDPGDMNTEMHGLAEPGIDLSDLPDPAASAPAFVSLVEDEPASGRYQAQELVAAVR